ncbi:hypothetical protein [Pasteurella multocida]|uniref:hypothetical protein n=1 Tax=Pasteurella multocida TaxID=747 RepID=UPI001B8AAC11|nr:hypothetical protein [Pasteurella multocida]MBR8514981.1 hypothetical protein [Pasteurella multocida]
MNILEIYQKNPNTVFIARDGGRYKVLGIKQNGSEYLFINMYSIEDLSKLWVFNDGKNTYALLNKSNEDIIDYEKPPAVFTVGEYVTRDGRKAIVHYDISKTLPNDTHPLFGYVEGEDGSRVWGTGGNISWDGYANNNEDLVGPWVEKQYVITVNGKEFHPVKNPKDGERLFYVNLLSSYVANSAAWGKQRSTDTALSNLNLIYRTEEEAQAFLEEISKPHTEIKHVD